MKNNPADSSEPGSHTAWSQTRQDVAAVTWPAFLVAIVANIVFFSFFDPAVLGEVSTPQIYVSRMTGYALGFFMFWVFLMMSSALTLFLIRTAHNNPTDNDAEEES